MEEVTLYIKPKNKRIIREVFYISSPDHYKSFGCHYCKIWEKKSKLELCNLCDKAKIRLMCSLQFKFATTGKKKEGLSYWRFRIMPKRFYVL